MSLGPRQVSQFSEDSRLSQRLSLFSRMPVILLTLRSTPLHSGFQVFTVTLKFF